MDDDDAAFLVSALGRHEVMMPHDDSMPRCRLPSLEARASHHFKGDGESPTVDPTNDDVFFRNLDLIFAGEPLPPPHSTLSPLPVMYSTPPVLPPPLPLPRRPPTPVYRFHVRLTTSFLPRYWKNGRKNLQCFPFCPEHGDFYEMKMQGKKHASIGVCRTPVNCELLCPVWLPNMFVIGRFEQISPGTPVPSPPVLQGHAEFDAFRQNTFDAVQIGKYSATTDSGGCKSMWMFLPDVWKLQPPLRKKRKATRSIPAETFPFYFRVFCYLQSPADSTSPVDWFRCVTECHSTPFELSSTRTADRHRKSHQ
ncbi:unnamed protein product [Aphanomyces euteiches]|nr:hypothetical protein AeRB84_016467 [Aphanomyces euteiches]